MLAKIAVTDYMSKHIITVTPDTPISHAIKKMLDHKVTSVPVVDERGKLVGVFSEKDCIKVVIETAYNQSIDAKVGDFMTKEPLIVNADVSLVDVAVKFQESSTRSFPVFKNGELIGMISRVDVLKALVSLR